MLDIKTPLGIIHFSVCADNLPQIVDDLNLCRARPRIDLPPGMSIEQCEACLLIVRPHEPATNLIVEGILSNAPCSAAPCSGAECSGAECSGAQ